MPSEPEILTIKGRGQAEAQRIIGLWKIAVPGYEEQIFQALQRFCEPAFRMRGEAARFDDDAIARELGMFPKIRQIRLLSSKDSVRMATAPYDVLTLSFMLLSSLSVDPHLIIPGSNEVADALWSTLQPNLPTIWRNCRNRAELITWVRALSGRQVPPTDFENAMRERLAAPFNMRSPFYRATLGQVIHTVLWVNLWTTAFCYCLLMWGGDKADADLLPLLQRFQTSVLPLGSITSEPDVFYYFRL